MIALRDGSILCASYLWYQMPVVKDAKAAKQPFEFMGGYIVRSRDGGRSWQGPILPPPTPGVRPSPQPQAGREPAAPLNKEQEAETKRIADEEIQKKQEEVRKRLQERQQDKQRRLEEADRLEREAKQPVQPTQENIDRQRKLMEEAQRLRDMQ